MTSRAERSRTARETMLAAIDAKIERLQRVRAALALLPEKSAASNENKDNSDIKPRLKLVRRHK